MIEEGITELDISDKERGVSSRDQLSPRTTIQKIIEHCLANNDRYGVLGHHVIALKQALYFNAEGLHLRDRIDEYETGFKPVLEDYMRQWILDRDNGIYYHPQTWDDLTFEDKSKYRIVKYLKYWNNLLDFLITLLVDYDAWIKSKKFVDQGESL